MQLQRNYIQSVKEQSTRPGPAASVNHVKPLLLAMSASHASFKNASVQALSILSPEEVRELVNCEEIIAKGWDTFVDVGRALSIIRDKRLYRADFETFESYCRTQWQYGKSHAYRLIGAAEVIACLSPIGDIPLPRNESQVRPLLGLKEDEVQAIWREVVKKAGKRHVTARLVKQTVAQFKAPAQTSTTKTTISVSKQDLLRLIIFGEKVLQTAKQKMESGKIRESVKLLAKLNLRVPTA